MSDDRSIERTARSWLEAGPTRAPDHIVLLALDRIETTPQDRVWPSPLADGRMARVYRLATAFAVVAAMLAGGLLLLQRGTGPGPAVSPSTSPTASPTASPSGTAPGPASTASPADAGGPPVLTRTFTSPLHGYSVQYSGEWTATPATETWGAGVVLQWGSPALDELRGSEARFVGASQPLLAGQTAEEWLQAFSAGSCLGDPSNWHPVSIGTVDGLIDADGCDAPGAPLGKGGQLFDAVVVFDGRAYDFTMDGQVSHADFVAVLATVTLNPAAAVDTSASP
jgi:hypothetical protein